MLVYPVSTRASVTNPSFLYVVFSSVVVLVNSLEPAYVVVRVRYHMHSNFS